MSWLSKLLHPKPAQARPRTPFEELTHYVAGASPRADIAVTGSSGYGKSTFLADLFQTLTGQDVKATVIVRHPCTDVWADREKAGALPCVSLYAYDWTRRLGTFNRSISSPEFQALNVRIVQEGIQAARAQGSRWLLIEWVELTAESVARVRAFRNEQMPELGLAFVAHSLSELGAAANELGALVVFSSLRAEESGWPAWMSALSVEEAQFHRKTFAPGENLIYLRE